MNQSFPFWKQLITEEMSNSIAANDIIQNIDNLLAEYPVDECISILQEVVKQIDVRIKDLVNIHN
mgnify:FL=1